MAPEHQGSFIEEFKRKKKSVAAAYVLWLLLGVHYGYLGKWWIQLLYWFTLGGLLIWAIVDIFRIPSMVRNYNKDVAIDVFRDLKIISS